MDRIEIKAAFSVSDEGMIEGIAWPFGTPDRVGDEILPGAFTKAIGPIPMMAFHDQKETVGVWDSISETAQGLVVKGRLLVNQVARAKEILALVKEKALPALSIGFATRKASPRRGGGRTISELDLMEISIVAVGAHPGALITSAKAAAAGKESDMDNQEQVAAPEQLAALESKMGEIGETLKGIATINTRLDKLEAKANRPGGEGASTDADAEVVRKSFATYLRLGNQTPVEDLKALTVSSDPQAGYLAPAEMSSEFIRDLVEYSPIRRYASVRTTGAPAVKYPKRTQITNAQWEGELEESQESDVAFGMLEVPIHKLTTFVDISNELLADSGGEAEAEVRLALAEDFGQKEAIAYVNGSGVKQPEGFMQAAGMKEIINGHATNLSADKLIDLLYDLPAAYRNAPGAAWTMNGTTLAAVRKLKDGQGNYLWQPSYQAGQPETILGKPVVEMVDMPDIGSGNFPIVFGDWSAYRIVDRLSLSILSDPYTQARKGVTRMHATRRTGGRVLQAARFRKLKTATS